MEGLPLALTFITIRRLSLGENSIIPSGGGGKMRLIDRCISASLLQSFQPHNLFNVYFDIGTTGEEIGENITEVVATNS